MNHICNKLFILLLLFLADSNFMQNIAAQTFERPLQPGAILGFSGANINLHNADFSVVPGFGGYGDNFSKGSGLGLALGVGAEYFPSARIFGISYRVGGLLHYSNFSAAIEKQDFIGNVIQGNKASEALVKTSLNSSISAMLLEPYLALYPWNEMPLSVKIGIQTGIPISAQMVRREELVAPEGVTFETGSRIRNEKYGEIPGNFTLFSAGIVAFQYEISLGPLSTLKPEISYSLALADISSSLAWKVNVLRIGSSFSYRLPKPRIEEKPSLPPPPQHIVKDATLTLSTRMFVNGLICENGQLIAVPIDETKIIERSAFAPTVFFERNSENLLKSSASADAENSDVIDAIAVYLKSHPSDKLTVTTYYADDETAETAQKRGEAVELMLRRKNADFGNISFIQGEIPKKIQRSDLRDEMRKATFAINGKQEPLNFITEKTIQHVNPIVIKSTSRYVCDDRPANIHGTLRYGDKLLANLEDSDKDIRLDPLEFQPLQNAVKLQSEYTLTDANGKSISDAVSVMIQYIPNAVKEKINFNEAKEYEEYILGYFSFDSSDFSSADTFVVDRVKTSVQQNKTIELIGLTDDLGTEEYNKKLAYKRIEAALTLLGLHGNQVRINIQDQVFAKDSSPYSRTRNRSVVVRIR